MNLGRKWRSPVPQIAKRRRVAPKPHVVFLKLGLGRVRFAGLLPDPADPIESGGALTRAARGRRIG